MRQLKHTIILKRGGNPVREFNLFTELHWVQRWLFHRRGTGFL